MQTAIEISLDMRKYDVLQFYQVVGTPKFVGPYFVGDIHRPDSVIMGVANGLLSNQTIWNHHAQDPTVLIVSNHSSYSGMDLALILKSNKTSYCKITWGPEAVKLVFWNYQIALEFDRCLVSSAAE